MAGRGCRSDGLFGTVLGVVWAGVQGEVLLNELGGAFPCGYVMEAVAVGDYG